MNVPAPQGVQGLVPVGLELPAEHTAAVPHCTPEKPGSQKQAPVVGLLFMHVPLPLHSISQPVPLEHGLQAQTDELKLQTPAPLQLSGQGPKPDTRDAGRSVSRVLPMASAARTLSTVRPAVFSMVRFPPVRACTRSTVAVYFPRVMNVQTGFVAI